MPIIQIDGKKIKFDSKEQVSCKHAGIHDEFVIKLIRSFGNPLFYQFQMSTSDGSLRYKKIIKAVEVQ